MAAPEFSRPLNAAGLPHAGRDVALSASAAECQALAARFGIPGITRLAAALHAKPGADGRIRVVGRITAGVVQVCVVSLEPFETALDVPYESLFLRQDLLDAEPEGLLDPEAIDEEGYTGTHFDLGESVAQALALALDPWPRNPDAVAPADQASDDDTPPPASPFAVLARRRG
jgi:uncharacterized metal-binding protein YceD (DUF177 family)